MDMKFRGLGPARCRVIIASDLATTVPQLLYTYPLCLQPATIHLMDDGIRTEEIPVCENHMGRLLATDGRREFSIDSCKDDSGKDHPVITPDWASPQHIGRTVH
jgi:hypothetical protein